MIRSRAGGYIELGEVVEGTAYDFRFRWSRGMRLFPGAWVEQLDHTIVGQTSPPTAVVNFSVTTTLEGFRAGWTNPESIDLAGVIVYTGTSTTFANASEVGRTSDNYFLATGLQAGVALFIWVRTVDFGGREGPLSGPLEVTHRRNGWAKFTTLERDACASGHSWRAGRHGGKRRRVVLVQDEHRLAVSRRPDDRSQ